MSLINEKRIGLGLKKELEPLVANAFVQLPSNKFRVFLFKHLEEIQEVYDYLYLDEVFAYLRIKLIEQSSELDYLRPDIEKLLEHGCGEYNESLNYFSQAIARIYEDKELKCSDIMTILSDMMCAFDCHESFDVYWQREVDKLQTKFNQLLQE